MTKIFRHLSAIIPNRFYFATINGQLTPEPNDRHFFITFDNSPLDPKILNYFGPPDLGMLVRYLDIINSLLKRYKERVIVQCTSIDDEKKRVNAAFLVGAYIVLILGKSAERAAKMVKSGQSKYIDFVDTLNNDPNTFLTLNNFLRGLEIATYKVRLFSLSDFVLDEYEYLAYHYGMMHWIVPNKLLAFPGPNQTTCHDYVRFFSDHKIRTVVRLNSPAYDKTVFQEAGIAHHDLYFPDCTAPTIEIVKHFLKICETTHYPVAVHCKAGYGRTGTLITAYIMKHFRMPALASIAWVRICRPGSVVAIQQKFLEENEQWLRHAGTNFKIKEMFSSLI